MQATAFAPIRVLVADDSHLIREIIGKTFQYEPKLLFVGEVDNYSKLFQRIKQSKPDVMLLDVHMPGRLEFSPAVIKSSLSGIPILCMSIGKTKRLVDWRKNSVAS
jgi:two-component system, NarL family, response regulator DesR